MLRYKTKTRPGLVALYDIRPGNGAGQFLQPQSPHGAHHVGELYTTKDIVKASLGLVAPSFYFLEPILYTNTKENHLSRALHTWGWKVCNFRLQSWKRYETGPRLLL